MSALDLRERMCRRIAHEGPLSLAAYMEMALGDPAHGYYMTRDPLGAAGDFTTAPEISQLFGELIGAWLVALAETRTAAPRIHLVELGPGRGTLMADILRVLRLRPALVGAVTLHLVETSPVLRAVQQRTLAGSSVAWHARLDEVPGDAPLLLVANEFLDALPVHQFERTADGWRERGVGLDGAGQLGPVLIGTAMPPVPAAHAHRPQGAVVEWRPEAETVARAIGRRIVAQGGAALLLDYGYEGPAAGDTFQALKDHAPVDPFAAPGEADLTAHVDFSAIAEAARGTGARVDGPTPLGLFLERLGIDARADALARSNPAAAPAIAAARRRLTGAEGMGSLFKAMALTPPHDGAPPGFR